MRRAILKIAGVGCEGCVAPSKERFLKVRGVKAVRVLGSRVEVFYDERDVALSELVRASGVENYYFVTVIGDEEVSA